MPSLEELTKPEYLESQRKVAEQRLAPSRDLALQQIGLAEQGIGQQETDINRLAAQNLRNLQEQATGARHGLEERFNQLGLLQSGVTAAGLGDIQKNLFRGTQETEQDKASRLANLALQRGGLQTQRAQTAQTYAQNIDDYVRQLIEGARTTELSRLETERLANQFQTLDLGNRVVLLNNRGEIVRTLPKGSLSSGGGGTDSGSSQIAELLAGLLGNKKAPGTPDQPNPPASNDPLKDFKDLTNSPTPPAPPAKTYSSTNPPPWYSTVPQNVKNFLGLIPKAFNFSGR